MEIYPLYQSNKRWEQLDYQKILDVHPMAPGESVQVINLDRTTGTSFGRTKAASFHLVRVRSQEKPHFHQSHDATAIMIQGKGTLHLKSEEISMKPGTIISIPRGAVHYFVNEDNEPALFYVIFTPSFDGKDRVRVRSVKDLLD